MNISSTQALVDKIRQGDRRSLARAMSLVDQARPDAQAIKDLLRQSTGQVPWWGFTGPPGVGKSTLIDAMLGALRDRGRRVGVVAVDPTSPVSDGALLGDRIRMMRHAADRDVFIRSLATHLREGGLSDATLHCARLLELARFDPVLIETVGVGQNELDVAAVADVTVVVLGPGYGDDIQLIKAGLLEIADVVVVNKCDQPEANRLLREVRAELGHAKGQKTKSRKSKAESRNADRFSRDPEGSAFLETPTRLEIVGTEAKSGKGVDQLLERLYKADRAARGVEQRRLHGRRRVLGEIRRSALLTFELALERALTAPSAEELVAKLEQGELSLDSVATKLSALSSQLPPDR